MTPTILRRPIAVSVIFLSFTTLGVEALFYLPVALLPELTYPSIIVETDVKSASARDVEVNVTEILESQFATLSGVKHIRSQSQNSVSKITLLYEWGTDLTLVQLDVRDRIYKASKRLPSTASKPRVIPINPASIPILRIAMSDSLGNMTSLSRFARSNIKRRLEQIDGVAVVDIQGTQASELIIELDYDLCIQHDISLDEIRSAFTDNHVQYNGGVVLFGQFQLTMRIQSQLETLEDIQSIVVKKTKHQRVTLGQVATVRFTEANKSNSVYYNDDAIVMLNIIRRSDANALDVADNVKYVLNELRTEYPQVGLNIISDDTRFVRESIFALLQSLIFGAICAFFVLVAFMRRIAYPFIISVSIPISVLLTFLVMYLQGISINMLSLGGLALGIGLIVDNSIVVLENIVRCRASGLSRFDATLKGTTGVALPVFASTLTTISVFAPLLLIPGSIGELFEEQALTIIYSLIMSAVTSLFFLPILYLLIAENEYPRNSYFEAILNLFSSAQAIIYRSYRRRLGHAIRHIRSYLIIGWVLGLFSILVFSYSSKSWIPPVERGLLEIELNFHPDSHFATVEHSSSDFIRRLSLSGLISDPLIMNGKVSQAFQDNSNQRISKSIIHVKVETDHLEMLQKKIDSLAQFYVGTKISAKPIQSPMELMFQRLDVQAEYEVVASSREALNHAILKLSNIPGVQPSPVYNMSELNFTPIAENMQRVHMPANKITQLIEFASRGIHLGYLKQFDDPVQVVLKSDQAFNESTFLNTVVKHGGHTYPLNMFLSKEMNSKPMILTKQDHLYSHRIKLNETSDAKVQLLNTINRSFVDLIEVFESKDVNDGINTLQWVLILAVSLVYMVLAAQFESLKIPFIIILTVPMSLIGVIFSTWLFGYDLNVMVLLGMIVLIGIVVNDAILKIDFIQRSRATGYSAIRSILNASKNRFRPILMTTITTCAALIPMLLIESEGSELRLPLAATIFFGLSAATTLTLIYIPILYLMIGDSRRLRD